MWLDTGVGEADLFQSKIQIPCEVVDSLVLLHYTLFITKSCLKASLITGEALLTLSEFYQYSYL